MNDQTNSNGKMVLGMTAAGAAMGAATEAVYRRAGIQRGFWERAAPLIIFVSLVAGALIWGYGLGDQVTTMNSCTYLVSDATFCDALWPTD